MRPIQHTCSLLLLPLLAATSCQNPTDSAMRNDGSGEITTSTGEWSVEVPSVESEPIAISTWLPETEEPIEVKEEISVAIMPETPAPIPVPAVASEHQAHASSAALAWLERSARTGSFQAQNQLGLFLRRCDETSCDPAQATMWLEFAEEQHAASDSCNTELQTRLAKRASWFTRTTGWSNPTGQRYIRSLNGR